MKNYLIHLAVEFIKNGKTFNEFIENEIAANASDDELRSIWNDAWFSVGMTKKVNQIVMNTTNYNRATAYFRMMEMIEPQDKKWGEFADAMDEMISTAVQDVVRCKDCVCYKDCIFWNGSHAKCCEKHSLYPDENWFCADGERKPTQTNAKNNAMDVR